MQRYRIRIYKSPGQQSVHVRSFTAPSDQEACTKASQIVAYIHHRKRLSPFITSWALDVLDPMTLGWKTVTTS